MGWNRKHRTVAWRPQSPRDNIPLGSPIMDGMEGRYDMRRKSHTFSSSGSASISWMDSVPRLHGFSSAPACLRRPFFQMRRCNFS